MTATTTNFEKQCGKSKEFVNDPCLKRILKHEHLKSRLFEHWRRESWAQRETSEELAIVTNVDLI